MRVAVRRLLDVRWAARDIVSAGTRTAAWNGQRKAGSCCDASDCGARGDRSVAQAFAHRVRPAARTPADGRCESKGSSQWDGSDTDGGPGAVRSPAGHIDDIAHNESMRSRFVDR